MADCSLYVLVPNKLTDASLVACSSPEPDGSRKLKDGSVENAWAFGTNYTKGQYVAYPTTHRVYRDAVGGTSSLSPTSEPLRWIDMGPTNRWAWADPKHGTRTVSTSPWSVTVRPGAFTAIEFLALSNVTAIRVEVWATPGGTLVYDEIHSTEDLQGMFDPYWAWFFQMPRYGNTLSLSDFELMPSCEVRITLSSYGGSLGVGLIAFGSYEACGETELDLKVSWRDFSRREWNLGELDFAIGPKAKDLSCTTRLARADANALERSLERFMNQGAVYVPSLNPQDRWMKTWGLLKPAEMTLPRRDKVFFSLEVEGFSA